MQYETSPGVFIDTVSPAVPNALAASSAVMRSQAAPSNVPPPDCVSPGVASAPSVGVAPGASLAAWDAGVSVAAAVPFGPVVALPPPQAAATRARASAGAKIGRRRLITWWVLRDGRRDGRPGGRAGFARGRLARDGTAP